MGADIHQKESHAMLRKDIGAGKEDTLRWKCPVCGAALYRAERVWQCENRHSYDISKSGYVNLLPPKPAGKRHGDDRLMVDARAEFLARGYYDYLMDAVAELCLRLTPETPCILDAGCGEGAYTRRIYDRLCAAGKKPHLAGVDISTEAVRRAAKRLPEGLFCAASTAHIPLMDGQADAVVNIFSPFLPGEFHRVMRQGGYLLRVFPLARHLWELKAAVYDTPYENPPLTLDAEGFTRAEEHTLRREIFLSTAREVEMLFKMTPYYYKTGAEDQKKLENVRELRVTTEFGIVVYKKE